MKTKTDFFALIFGFLIIVAYWPAWSQAAMEPKTLVLYSGGGVAWFGLAWQKEQRSDLSPMLWIPSFILVLSIFWSVNPLLGIQRFSLLMAAIGVSLFIVGNGAMGSLKIGFGIGLSVHSLILIAQNIPFTLRLMPSFLGPESLFGYPGGLFFNSNMAALPLLVGVASLIFQRAESSIRFPGLVALWGFSLLLTQSRACILAFVGCVTFWLIKYLNTNRKSIAQFDFLSLGLVVIASGWWAYSVHPWAGILWAGLIFGWGWVRPELPPQAWAPRRVLVCMVLVALGGGAAWRLGVRPARPQKGVVNNVGSSLEKRKSYYFAAVEGWGESPIWGKGLGSGRSHYPRLVDPTLPMANSGYGDFTRPNNLHSDGLQFLLEGGLLFLAALGLGLFISKRELTSNKWIANGVGLAPLLFVSMVDFPLHKPIGILWLVWGMTRILIKPNYISPWQRILMGVQAGVLVWLAIGLAGAASLRPRVESDLRHHETAKAWVGAQKVMNYHPFEAEFQDLHDKALVQWGASSEGLSTPRLQSDLLDKALLLDPWDHHLLLRRAQLEKFVGNQAGAQKYLTQYTAIAPPDPDRFLRFARDAKERGSVEEMRILIGVARRQPGWGNPQDLVANDLQRNGK